MLDDIVQRSLRTFAGATPIEGDGHVNVPLSNLAMEAFDATGAGFVTDQLVPALTVRKQSDRYFIIEKGQFLRIPDTTKRAPGTVSRAIEFQVSSSTYFAQNYALSHKTPLEFLENADDAIDFRNNAVRLVTTALKRDQEVRIARTLTSATNVGSGTLLTGTNKWGDANSDPIGQVNTGHAFILKQSGLMANTLVMDFDSFQIVRRHPMILDLFKYTSGGEATEDQLRSVFKVNRLLVAAGILHNENQDVDAETTSATNIWGNNCLLAHIEPSIGLQTATLAMRFRWQPPIFAANMGVQVDREDRAGQAHVETVEAGYYQDEKVVAPDLGYLIANTL